MAKKRLPQHKVGRVSKTKNIKRKARPKRGCRYDPIMDMMAGLLPNMCFEVAIDQKTDTPRKFMNRYNAALHRRSFRPRDANMLSSLTSAAT